MRIVLSCYFRMILHSITLRIIMAQYARETTCHSSTVMLPTRRPRLRPDSYKNKLRPGGWPGGWVGGEPPLTGKQRPTAEELSKYAPDRPKVHRKTVEAVGRQHQLRGSIPPGHDVLDGGRKGRKKMKEKKEGRNSKNKKPNQKQTGRVPLLGVL